MNKSLRHNKKQAAIDKKLKDRGMSDIESFIRDRKEKKAFKSISSSFENKNQDDKNYNYKKDHHNSFKPLSGKNNSKFFNHKPSKLNDYKKGSLSNIEIDNVDKDNTDSFFIWGYNSCDETLNTKPEKIEKIYLQEGKSFDNIVKIKNLAAKYKVQITNIPSIKIKNMIGEVNHQGIVMLMRGFEYVELDTFLKDLNINNNPCVVILDEIEDTHNVGAIIRSSVAAGVSAVIIPKHRGAPINGTVYKTSAGLIDKIPIIKVSNINSAIDKLKQKKFWIFGLDGLNGKNMWEQDLKGPTCIIVGNEEIGIRAKTSEHCDFLLSIPMSKKAESLNASVSAALAIYEWKRQNF